MIDFVFNDPIMDVEILCIFVLSSALLSLLFVSFIFYEVSLNLVSSLF
jgi:hypothetical protein